MKKLLVIVVLGLLWCNISFALTQQEAINKYLSNRPLDEIEGIYRGTSNGISVIAKHSGSYKCIIIKSKMKPTGTNFCSLNRSGGNYSGFWSAEVDGQLKRLNAIVDVFNGSITVSLPQYGNESTTWGHRIWPSDIQSHNAKLGGSSSSSSSSSDKITQAKQVCKDLGFKAKSEKFADCALKMMSIQFETTNKVSTSSGGTEQTIVVQQQNDYDVWDALLDMSYMLQNNNSSSSSGSSSTRCVVNRTNSTTGQTVMNCY